MKNSEFIMREKVEAHEFPFDAEAWQQMANRLKKDENEPKIVVIPKKNRWFKKGLFIVIGLLILAIWIIGRQLLSNIPIKSLTAKQRLEKPIPTSTSDARLESSNEQETLSGNAVFPSTASNITNQGINRLAANLPSKLTQAKIWKNKNAPWIEKMKPTSNKDTANREKKFTEYAQSTENGGVKDGISQNLMPTATLMSNLDVVETQTTMPANFMADIGQLPYKELALFEYISQAPQTTLNEKEIIPIHKTRMHWGVIVGAQRTLLKLENAKGWSTSPQLGFWMSYRLNERYSLQTGLQFKLVKHYEDLQTSFSDTISGPAGDITGWDYRFQASSLIFFEMPLVLSMQSRKLPRLNFEGGIRTGWVSPYNQLKGFSTVGNGAPKSPFNSVQDGLRKVDFGLIGGIEYRISNAWYIRCRFGQGLLDLSHDNFFQRTDTNTNTDIQVSIKFKIH